jgi:uncharacterized membrane protein (DUF373 family)
MQSKRDLWKFCNLPTKPFSSVFNILIYFLIIALLIIIIKELYYLFASTIWNGDVKIAIDMILFIFILIEIFTILIAYLKTEFIKVERIVEVGIISLVRDLIFHATTMEPTRTYGLSAILLVFGLLFFIEKYFSKERNLEQSFIKK